MKKISFIGAVVAMVAVLFLSERIDIGEKYTKTETKTATFATDAELEKAAKELAEKVYQEPVYQKLAATTETAKEIQKPVQAKPDTQITPYQVINNNVPAFTEEEMVTEPFEYYSELDALGRCGMAYANICKELTPTEERGEIGHIKPTGWHTIKYPDIISDKYLYNRCHLIAFCLAGENDNEKNLITGTRYMNVSGMLPFEEEVLYYVKNTGNHVLYRVTPVFEGNNLVASGVIMEAYSVEDHGQGVQFNVFVYNIQPGIIIDYATGDSKEDESNSGLSGSSV